MNDNIIRVLITGSEGQLAKTLIKCAPNKYQLFPLNKKKFNIIDFINIKNIILDIKPHVIINCASYNKVDLAEKEFEIANSVNSNGVENLTKIIKNQKILLVHFSSDYVYDGKKKSLYIETDETYPISKYGISKLNGEKIIINNLINYLIFRISWLYSIYNNNFLKKFINIANNNDEINVINNNFGRPTNSECLSNFIWIAIEKTLNNKSLCGIYNYSDSGIITNWYEIVSHIYNFLQNNGKKVPKLRQISYQKYNLIALRPENSSLNIEKLKLNFKYQAKDWKINLNKTLRELIR